MEKELKKLGYKVDWKQERKYYESSNKETVTYTKITKGRTKTEMWQYSELYSDNFFKTNNIKEIVEHVNKEYLEEAKSLEELGYTESSKSNAIYYKNNNNILLNFITEENNQTISKWYLNNKLVNITNDKDILEIVKK